MNIANFINRVVAWLQARPVLNIILIFSYFLFILFMHNPLVQLYLWLEKLLTLNVLNLIIAAIFLLVVTALAALLSKQFSEHPENAELKIFYSITTLAALLAHSRFMFDSNIEVIHSLEFTLLALLIFPFTKRFGATVFFVLPFMLIDEWWQYTILYPTLDYLDLNDVMMDTYGCALAMLVFMITGVEGQQTVKLLWKRVEFISLVTAILLILIAVKICVIAPYANDACSNTLLVINERTSPEPFLRFHTGHKIWFHVMKPFEGLIAIASIHLFYFGMDSLRKNPA